MPIINALHIQILVNCNLELTVRLKNNLSGSEQLKSKSHWYQLIHLDKKYNISLDWTKTGH
jgi:hypothetical protein